MPFAFFDHTGDVGVRLRAPTLAGLFAEGAAALTATLVDPGGLRPVERRVFALEADSPDLLLVDWLNELVYRFEVEDLLVVAVDARVARRAGRWHLEATVDGERFDPSRHAARVLVKSATYHRLEVVETPDEFDATVVFDI